MLSGRQEFERQLRDLGIEPIPGQPENRTVFDYLVPAGRFKGQAVKIGLDVPPDFSRNPPGGINVSPCLLPLNPGAPDHPNRVVQSGFGPDWQYWSRRFLNWKETGGALKYLAFIDRLFETIP